MNSAREWLKKLFGLELTPAREYNVRVSMDEALGKRVKLVLIDSDGTRYAVDATLLPSEGWSFGYGAQSVLVDCPPRDEP